MTSYTESYIHYIWATRQHEALITNCIEADLYLAISQACASLNCTLLAIGGASNHIHMLVRMNNSLPLSAFADHIKSSSAEYMNTITDRLHTFEWHTGYKAFAISKSCLSHVRNYVLDQKQRHAEGRLIDELEQMDHDDVLTYCNSQ